MPEQKSELLNHVYYYEVQISDGSGIISRESKFKKDVLDVIAENDNYIAVNDYSFTTISKKKSDFRSDLIKSSISLDANDRVWGNRIWYTRYSIKPITAKKIRKEIEAAILKKYGFFSGKIDLSIISDKVKSVQP